MMKVTGVIAEYNPFHNGHAYHIRKSREKTGADYVIAAMSGNFVQRGAPAILDKFERAAMALSCGADLVLEIPAVGAVASAEVYARSGIAALAACGIITSVAFGCEAADADSRALLADLAAFYADPPADFQESVRALIKNGLTYPQARMRATLPFYKKEAHERITALLQSPNAILAIEYQKAIRRLAPAVTPVPIQRIGSGYHDRDMTGAYASASAIRRLLLGPALPPDDTFPAPLPAEAPAALTGTVPPAAEATLTEALAAGRLMESSDFSSFLHYALTAAKESLPEHYPQEPELAGRILRILPDYKGWRPFAEALKTRNRTLTAVCRYLTQILLGIDKKAQDTLAACAYAPYIRVLGVRSDAEKLLGVLSRHASVPVIVSPAGDRRRLTPEAAGLFAVDVRATDIYHAAASEKCGASFTGDYRQPLLLR